MKNKRLIAVSLLVIVSATGMYAYAYYQRNTPPVPKTLDIVTFEECAAAGYPIMESYPEKCSTPDGQTFTKVYPDAVPIDITTSGSYTCLPKKDTGGPVTLECAFGLRTDEGYYALDLSTVLSENYPTLTGNEQIRVDGTLVPIEMISSDRYRTYDNLIGIIAVESVTIL